MSEEETKKEEGADADSTQESEKQETDTSNKEDEVIDYKKQLEETEKELKQAQFKLKQANIEKKNESKKESSTKEDGVEEEDSNQEEEIDSVVEQKLEKFKLEIRKDDIGSELSKLSEDEDEQKLIKILYENKIVKSGYDRESIAKDLKAAQLLANAPRIERVLKEKKAFDDSKRGTGGGGGGGQKIASDSGTTKEYSADDLRLMKLYNIKPEDIKD